MLAADTWQPSAVAPDLTLAACAVFDLGLRVRERLAIRVWRSRRSVARF